MSKFPVGATWEGTDPADFMNYTIVLAEIRNGIEIWNWYREYADGSRPDGWTDWGTSYQDCRRQLYLNKSGIRMKRVK